MLSHADHADTADLFFTTELTEPKVTVSEGRESKEPEPPTVPQGGLFASEGLPPKIFKNKTEIFFYFSLLPSTTINDYLMFLPPKIIKIRQKYFFTFPSDHRRL